MKLEATWILTNIGYGDEEDIAQIFAGPYGFVDHLNRILKGNDLQMIDQVIWLISNSIGDSIELRKRVLSSVFIIENLFRVIHEAIKCNA
jgi:hypothetical protein